MRLLDSVIETRCGADKGDALNTRKVRYLALSKADRPPSTTIGTFTC
jgi:hypothetical protein